MFEEYCMALDVRPILWPFIVRPAPVLSATQAFCTAYASSMVMSGCWMESWRICVRARSDSSSRRAASRMLISSNMRVLLADNCVFQTSDSFDLGDHFIAHLHVSQAFRRPGQNDVARRESHKFAKVSDQRGNVEDHVAR